MDREYISQHNVIERYLSGSLTDEERAAFEERCLWCSDTLQELNVAERLREGLRDVDMSHGTAPARGPLTRWLFSPQWAAAASVMLVVSLGTTGWLLTQMQVPDAALATTQVYSIEMTRGDEAPSTVVRVGPDDRWVVLLVYPELGRHERYRAELYRSGEALQLWQASDIPPGTAESLALTLPAELLSPGAYRLGVIGLNEAAPGDPVGEVSFRVATAE
ncbi:MAG TPA: hypothetical protein VMQ83_11670 [Gammaproteobacteria bacterium]|nr:hypothetical protein [Gammaproteobacteria bacterium]